MRALLSLSAVLILLPRPAHAQVCPTGCAMDCPADSAHPGLVLNFPADCQGCYADEAVIECSCYDRCGGDGDGGGGGGGGGGYTGGGSTQQQPQGVPPGLKALATLVAFAFAPAFTLDLKRSSADIQAEVDRARAEWLEYREDYADVEARGERWQAARRRQRQWTATLQRDMAASAKAPKAPADYQPIPPAATDSASNDEKWGEDGYCRALIESGEQQLVDAEQAVTEHALGSFLPTTTQLLADAKQTARDALVRGVGAEEYAKQLGRLKQMYDEANQFSRLMSELQGCLASVAPTRDLAELDAINRCLAPLHNGGVTKPLWSYLKKQVGQGVGDALERVRDFTAFYTRYVRTIGLQKLEMALAAPGCGR